MVQDYSREMVVVGTDVVSLYPNLTWEAAGGEVFRAIVDSDVVQEGVNWKEGCQIEMPILPNLHLMFKRV